MSAKNPTRYADPSLEAMILVAMWELDKPRLDIYFPLLKPGHFHFPETEQAYECFKWMYGKGAETLNDRALIDSWCANTGKDKFSVNLDLLIPMIRKAEHHGKVENLFVYLQELDDRYRACMAFETMARASKDGIPGTFLSSCRDVAGRYLVGNIRNQADDMKLRCLNMIQSIVDGENPVDDYVSSGLRQLDWIIKGFRWDALNTVASRPGIGKTSIALQFGTSAVQSGVDVLFLSLEMTMEKLMHRIVAQNTGIDADEVERNGKKTHSGGVIAAEIEKVLKHWSIRDEFEKTLAGVEMIFRIEMDKKKYGLVIVDHLQEINYPSTQLKRHQTIGIICDRLKELGREYRVPVVLLAQVNRGLKPKSAPQLENLKDSGAIEEKSGIVIFMHKPDPLQKHTELIVAKNRYGDNGFVKLWHEKQITKFIERTDRNE
jgi:replicative DNA helicase